jgi:membrane-associated protease RseP (regulator of RpoE activity)
MPYNGEYNGPHNAGYDRLDPMSGRGVGPKAGVPWVNILLFAATVVSTLVVGTFLMSGFQSETLTGPAIGPFEMILNNPGDLVEGIPFAFALLSILMAHEMGHYLTCRHYGISATLPYFIPAPTFIGTFGAFIRIRSPFQHRAALLEVGVAGPIAGFFVALPVLAIALTQSRMVDASTAGGSLSLGEPLIFSAMAALMGVHEPAGMELYLHPVGFAAWVGFLVTALNLLPIGQLDGGHAIYAIFPKAHSRISQAAVFLLIPLGIFFWLGWLVWAVLMVLLGTRHAPTTADDVPLGRRQAVLGVIGLILLVLCFVPVPTTITP